jgi:Family of unknown function (DUF6455)
VELVILLIVAAAVMAIILGGTYLTCQRVQNYCALEAKREKLVTRVLNSRLGRMLRSLNISLRDYVRRFPATAITGHLNTCQNCDASTACDAYLADNQSDPARAREFCPNMSDFDRLREGTNQKAT